MTGWIPLRSRAHALAVATIMLVPQQSARAQDSTAASTAHSENAETRTGWLTGPLIGLPGAGSEAAVPLITLGYGVTRLVPNQPGLDFSIGTAPYALAFGVIPVAARVGPSIPLALGQHAFLIPSAGVSAVSLFGLEVGPPVIAWYSGAAVVVAHGPVGFRAGMTWHRTRNSDPPVWLAEVGIMKVPLPRRAH